MPGTVDLDPEWGPIDVVKDIEDAFGIQLDDDDVERCITAGDLYELVRAKAIDWESQNGVCASSRVFYQIRRALDPDRTANLTPSSPLGRSKSSASRLLSFLHRETGLQLPDAQATTLGIVGAWVVTVGFVGGLVALTIAHWLATVLALPLLALGLVLCWLDPAKLPRGVVTVGDLAKRVASLNAKSLVEGGARPPDRWSILVNVLSYHGELAPDDIKPDTALLR